MDKKPKITMVVPLYNAEAYIEECLGSVKNQDYDGPIECIVVDDCGNDNSVAVVEKYISKNASQVEFKLVHHNQNRGLSAARNTGIEHATGEYIGFLDSDDYIEPNMFSKLMSVFDQYKNVGVASSLFYAYPKNSFTSFVDFWLHKDNENIVVMPEDLEYKLISMSICHSVCGKLFQLELIKNLRFVEGRLNEDTRFDFDLACEMVKQNLALVEIPDQLYAYRTNENGICMSSPKLNYDKYINLREIRALTHNDNVIKYIDSQIFRHIYSFARSKQTEIVHPELLDVIRKYSILDAYKFNYSIKKIILFGLSKSRLFRKFIVK